MTDARTFPDGLATHLAVALGAALGGVLRAGLSVAMVELAGPGFPWGTLAVNVIGSFAIGVYAALTGPKGRLAASARQTQFVIMGLCGGFTTFSLFSLETLRLAAAGEAGLAALYAGGSVVLWLLAVWAGHALAMRFNLAGSAPR